MKYHVAASIASDSPAHASMAAKALTAVAERTGCDIAIEMIGTTQGIAPLSDAQIAAADVVIFAGEAQASDGRFATKAIYRARTSDVITGPEAVIAEALATVSLPFKDAPTATTLQAQTTKRLVAITSCPTGIAHTFMAAEALKKAAAALGHQILVETQGSVGAKNTLTAADIAAADAIVIAADTNVDLGRFGGKAVYSTSTKQAMHRGKEVIEAALAEAQTSPASSAAPSTTLATDVERIKAERSASRSGVYKNLMTGVSYMLPVVVAGGLSIALSFAIGGAGTHAGGHSLVAALDKIGGAAFGIFVAVLSAYIAYSIADRPGIAPGLVGGVLAQSLGAGFLGGIAAGFLAGHLTKIMADKIKLPSTLEGLKPILILPFAGSVIVGLLMIYVVAPPVETILNAMTAWLSSMRESNALILGAILGGMMAFDMGGPVNKAAYTFSVGLLASHIATPMAAVMAAGMTPPLGLAIATLLFKNRFDDEEREAAGAAFVLGLAFITEGAIPFAGRDPLRVIPSLVVGSAIAGAISMASGVQLFVPHGGVFAMLIPGAVTHSLIYFGAILAGATATTGMLFVLKRPVAAEAPVGGPIGAPSLAAR